MTTSRHCSLAIASRTDHALQAPDPTIDRITCSSVWKGSKFGPVFVTDLAHALLANKSCIITRKTWISVTSEGRSSP